MSIDDNFYMSLAIAEAWKFQLITYPNPAVGCVVVKNGKILAIEAHKEAGKPHAEVNATKTAFLSQNKSETLQELEDATQITNYLLENHNNFFEDCDFFVTLEPCNHVGKTPPCARLLEILHPNRVIIGSCDPNQNATGGINRLKEAKIQIDIGVMQKECDKLLYPFVLSQKHNNIKLFKMAQRLNGTFDDGSITSKNSLEYLHKIREKIDILAIGGNTVRIDRPTLDCRYSNSLKAPDITIISRQKNFDKTIPLFEVENRNIYIENDLHFLNTKKFFMFEGGENLLNLVYNNVNLFLFVVSVSKIGGRQNLNTKFDNLELLNSTKFGDEVFIWLKKKEV